MKSVNGRLSQRYSKLETTHSIELSSLAVLISPLKKFYLNKKVTQLSVLSSVGVSLQLIPKESMKFSKPLSVLPIRALYLPIYSTNDI